YDWHLMRRLLVYLEPYKWRVVAALALIMATAGLQILAPYLVKVAIDQYITKHNVSGLNKIAILYLFVLAVGMVLSYSQVFIMQMTGQHIMYDLRVHIFEHLRKLELNFFHKNPVGRLMTRVTNDVDVLNDLFTSGVVSIFGDVFTLTGIMIAM